MWQTVADTQDYCGVELITAVKSFVKQAPLLVTAISRNWERLKQVFFAKINEKIPT